MDWDWDGERVRKPQQQERVTGTALKFNMKYLYLRAKDGYSILLHDRHFISYFFTLFKKGEATVKAKSWLSS